MIDLYSVTERLRDLNPLTGEPADTVLDKLACRFSCDDPVVGIYYIPEGCWCWPDPVQALCAQHAIKVESTGEIICLIKRGP